MTINDRQVKFQTASGRNKNFKNIVWTWSINIAWFQGIVTGVGENSEFGEVFKMMKAEEVSNKEYL